MTRPAEPRALSVALIVSVPVFEDFYVRHGITRDAYLTTYDADWICYYTRLLQREGFRLTWYLFSRETRLVESHRHEPTGGEVRFLPASPLYNWWTVRLPWIHHFSLHLATVSGALVRDLHAHRPDVLYVQDYESGRFDVVSLLAARLGIPVIGQFHGGHSPARWPLRALRRWAIRRAACILSPNSQEHRRVQETYGLDEARARYFPNPVPIVPISARPPGEVKQRVGIPPTHRYILFLGRLDANKGVDVLLEAFRGLSAQAADLHLVVAGDGPDLAQLQRAAAAVTRVHFLGWISSRERIQELLGAAEAVACPSGEEAFCYTAAEAMVAARPVVASAVGGLNDLVVDGVTGYLVPPRDAGALGTALNRLLADPDLVARMGRKGRERAERAFADTVLVPQLVDILEHAARSRTPVIARS